jgi:hydrogenase 3 maturation protease
MNLEDFISELKNYRHDNIVFIGLGNEQRNDDAAGLLFLRLLVRTMIFERASFIEAERNPENYLEIILRYEPEAVVFIDAADWAGFPGEIKWLQSDDPSIEGFSTHTFSVKLIAQYLSAFKPIDFYYLGIQAADLGLGNSVTNEIKESFIDFFKPVEII